MGDAKALNAKILENSKGSRLLRMKIRRLEAMIGAIDGIGVHLWLGGGLGVLASELQTMVSAARVGTSRRSC